MSGMDVEKSPSASSKPSRGRNLRASDVNRGRVKSEERNGMRRNEYSLVPITVTTSFRRSTNPQGATWRFPIGCVRRVKGPFDITLRTTYNSSPQREVPAKY